MIRSKNELPPRPKKLKKINAVTFERLANKVKKYFEEEEKYMTTKVVKNENNNTGRFPSNP